MGKSAKQAVLEYFDRLLNRRDFSVCDELLSPRYIDHDAGPQAAPGPSLTKSWVADFLSQYSEMRVEVQDIVSEGQKVAVRLIWRGRRADNGEGYHREGIVILHLDDSGRILERWSAYF